MQNSPSMTSCNSMSSEDGIDLPYEEDSHGEQSEGHAVLAQFWEKVMDDIKKIDIDDFKQQALPLARIKKIMKLDEDVKMISAEAPLLFAKAAEIFIHELTLRAWIHTEENKRRTLQKNDIGSAAAKSDQYDFLIDILPPDELKHTKPRSESPNKSMISQDQVQYYLQLAQQHQEALQVSVPQIHSQPTPSSTPTTQVVQVANPQPTPAPQPQSQPALQILQQIVTPNGEIQQIPIQLTPNQLNLIRMHMQNGTGQPVIIQSGAVGTAQPQLIQISSQPQQPHPVFLTQVNPSQEDEILS